MEKTRLDDMLERYGEVCTQRQAAKILGINPRTIYSMLDDGRLRRFGTRVDVRSICDYLDNSNQRDLRTRTIQRKATGGPTISDGDFFAAARNGRWAPHR